MNDPLATHRIKHEPYYRSTANEVKLFELAHQLRIPMILKGPTGCGKTRFVEHMAWRLSMPLISVACNDDLTASDLVGRWLLNQDGTYWQDGPLAMAVRHGAIATWMKWWRQEPIQPWSFIHWLIRVVCFQLTKLTNNLLRIKTFI